MNPDPLLRILIVDDEALAVERLAMLCAATEGVEVVGTAIDGEHALRLVEALAPDLILLDIAMPEVGGLAVARALESVERAPAIVFCTAFDRFAIEAFDLAAVDYLLKPVAPDKLARAFDRARTRHRPAQTATVASPWVQEFWVPHRDDLVRIAALDIDRIEAERDYMRLHVGTRRFLINQTITGLEQRLDPACFLRLHRSHIVRRDFIEALTHERMGVWVARLIDGNEIRIGRSYLANVRAMAATCVKSRGRSAGNQAEP